MASTPRPRSRLVCHYFYKEIAKNVWQCNNCMKNKSKNGGWTNLLVHLRSCVGSDYEKAFIEHHKVISSNNKASSGFFIRVSNHEKEIFSWIKFIVMKTLPVSFVECPFTRDIAKLKPISAPTLQRHILSLLSVVKEAIKNELPSKFTLVVDGWTEGSQHYISVVAAYLKVVDGKEVPTQTMLSMRPLLVEGIQGITATDQLEHVQQVLEESYGKAFSNVICLVLGDTCLVNQCMAQILHVPLIGCASHKFNLAVRHWITQQAQLTPIIEKVKHVMKKASTLKVAAQLQELTSYCEIRENDTRWSYTFQLIQTFLSIQTHLGGVVELLSLLPNNTELEYLTSAFESLKKFDVVSSMLQHEGISFVESREICEVVLIDYPDFANYIGDDALMVASNELFEKAVMRIARSLPLSEEQQAIMAPFEKERKEPTAVPVIPFDNQDNNDDDPSESYAVKLQRKLKRQRIEAESEKPKTYINLDVLPGTAVNCERLFRTPPFALSDTRRATSPELFEALILLKVNMSYWNECSVGQAMAQSNNDSNIDDVDIAVKKPAMESDGNGV